MKKSLTCYTGMYVSSFIMSLMATILYYRSEDDGKLVFDIGLIILPNVAAILIIGGSITALEAMAKKEIKIIYEFYKNRRGYIFSAGIANAFLVCLIWVIILGMPFIFSLDGGLTIAIILFAFASLLSYFTPPIYIRWLAKRVTRGG